MNKEMKVDYVVMNEDNIPSEPNLKMFWDFCHELKENANDPWMLGVCIDFVEKYTNPSIDAANDFKEIVGAAHSDFKVVNAKKIMDILNPILRGARDRNEIRKLSNVDYIQTPLLDQDEALVKLVELIEGKYE